MSEDIFNDFVDHFIEENTVILEESDIKINENKESHQNVKQKVLDISYEGFDVNDNQINQNLEDIIVSDNMRDISKMEAKHRKHVCPYSGCGQRFSRSNYLKEHLNRHKNIKSFKCSFDGCNKEYFIYHSLYYHIQTFHYNKDLRYNKSSTKKRVLKKVDNKIVNTCPKTKVISESMPRTNDICIKVNDIFDELNDENKRLNNELMFANNCLKVLNRFKTFLDKIYLKFDKMFESEDKQELNQLKKDFNSIIKSENTMKSESEIYVNLNNSEDNHINSFVCPFNGCEYKSKDKTRLKLHLMSLHSMSRPFKCNVCFKGFKCKSIRDYHQLTHKSKPTLLCNINGCPQLLTTLFVLSKHRKLVHNIPYKKVVKRCKWLACNYQTYRSDAFFIHRLKHTGEKPYLCPIIDCGLRFRLLKTLKTHELVHKTKTKQQLRPQNKFRPKNIELQQNVQKEVDTSFKGMDQNYNNSNEYLDEVFISKNNESNSKKKKKVFICNYAGCGQQFARNNYLTSHFNKHLNVKPYKCTFDGCTKDYYSYNCLYSHLQSVHNITSVKELDQKIVDPRSSDSKSEQIYKTNDENNGKSTLNKIGIKSQKIINKSNENTNNSLPLKTQKAVINGKEREKIDEMTSFKYLRANNFDPNTRSYVCSTCDKSFTRIINLRVHIRFIHHNIRRFVCQHTGCGMAFATKQTLQRHTVIIHSDEKPLSCDYDGCSYRCKTQCHLKTHMRSVHIEGRPYDCDVCGKTFKYKKNLRTHTKYTHYNPNSYATPIELDHLMKKVCPVEGCQFKCRYETELSKHTVAIHSIGLFKCDICQRRFRDKSNLSSHKLIHKKEPTLRCNIDGCSELFRTDYKRMRHRMFVHNIVYEPKIYTCDWPGCDFQVNRSDTMSKHKRIHTGEKPYVCEWPECNKSFRLYEVFKSHQLIHKNLKPFACVWPGCQYRCRSSGNLTIHRRIHNK